MGKPILMILYSLKVNASRVVPLQFGPVHEVDFIFVTINKKNYSYVKRHRIV